jgi:hypothetical protein
MPPIWLSDIDLDELFQLLIPRLTSVLLLESELGFEIVTQLMDSGRKRPY